MLMSRKWDITKDRIDPVPGDPSAATNPSPIAYGDGKLTRKAPAGKRPEITSTTFLSVDASGINSIKDEAKRREISEKLDRYTQSGFSSDPDSGIRYVPLCQSPGGVKGAQSIWVDASKRDAIMQWWHCGYVLDDLDLFTRIEKDARMFTACAPWEEFFGDTGSFTQQLRMPVIPEIDIRKLYVLEEVETANHLPLEGEDHVYGIHDKKWIFNHDPHAEKDSDGVIYYIIRDASDYTIEERRVFRRLAEEGRLPDLTINAPGFKGCVHFLLESTLKLFFKKEGLNSSRKDVFGREFDLFEDAQVICGKSAFKWVKSSEVMAGGFELFENRFLEYGHTFDVSVVPHPVWRPLPYQMTTGLWPDNQGEQQIIARSVDRLRGYADPEQAVDLLPRFLKDALELCPSMWADPYLKFSLQAAYERKRWNALACMLDKAGKYFFVLPDTALCLQAWFGNPDQAVGVINGGFVIHQPSLKEVGEYGWITVLRNPMPGLNQCPRQLQPVPADYAGLYGSGACFVSGQDDSMARMQCDFDGDKVFVVVDPLLCELFRSALGRTGYRTVRWINSDLPKPQFTWQAFREFIVKAPLAEVGLVFNNGNRIKAADADKGWEYSLQRNGLVEVAGTNIIDAAKGTGEKVTALDDLIERYYKKAKPGAYIFYKKTPSSAAHISALKSSERQRLSEIVSKNDQKYKHHPNFWMDRLSEAVRENTPETLTVEAPEAFGRFNISLLYGEAATKGETRFAELLDDAIEEHSTLYRAVQGSDNMAARREAQEMFYEDLRAQILARGLACGLSVSQTVTALVKAVYNGAFTPGYNMYIHERHFRIMWMCFGKELLANLAANCKKAGDQLESTPSVSSENLEEEEETDYIEDYACWSDEDADGEFIM